MRTDEQKAYSKAYYLANKDRYYAYRLEHKDDLSKKKVEYRALNKPKTAESDKKYRLKNKEAIKNKLKATESDRKEYQKAYRQKNREALNAKQREAYSVKINTIGTYVKPCGERRRVYNQNRRERIAATGKLSTDIALKLMKSQQGLCVCCRKPLGKDYHLDHIIPLALGGTNTDLNMQLLTANCNRQKAALDPIYFMQTRGLLL